MYIQSIYNACYRDSIDSTVIGSRGHEPILAVFSRESTPSGEQDAELEPRDQGTKAMRKTAKCRGHTGNKTNRCCRVIAVQLGDRTCPEYYRLGQLSPAVCRARMSPANAARPMVTRLCWCTVPNVWSPALCSLRYAVQELGQLIFIYPSSATGPSVRIDSET